MGAYQENLRHIAEPAAPSEREKAASVGLADHVALWFAEHLRDYAHYEAEAPHNGIAVGLASYIDKKVRDEGNSYVSIYAHTDEAVEAIESAWTHGMNNGSDNPPHVAVGDALDALHAERTDAPDPEVTDLDGEETVVFDEQEARESFADMQIAKAEGEHLAEIEADANARGVNNRKTPRVNPRYNE